MANGVKRFGIFPSNVVDRAGDVSISNLSNKDHVAISKKPTNVLDQIHQQLNALQNRDPAQFLSNVKYWTALQESISKSSLQEIPVKIKFELYGEIFGALAKIYGSAAFQKSIHLQKKDRGKDPMVNAMHDQFVEVRAYFNACAEKIYGSDSRKIKLIEELTHQFVKSNDARLVTFLNPDGINKYLAQRIALDDRMIDLEKMETKDPKRTSGLLELLNGYALIHHDTRVAETLSLLNEGLKQIKTNDEQFNLIRAISQSLGAEYQHQTIIFEGDSIINAVRSVTFEDSTQTCAVHLKSLANRMLADPSGSAWQQSNRLLNIRETIMHSGDAKQISQFQKRLRLVRERLEDNAPRPPLNLRGGAEEGGVNLREGGERGPLKLGGKDEWNRFKSGMGIEEDRLKLGSGFKKAKSIAHLLPFSKVEPNAAYAQRLVEIDLLLLQDDLSKEEGTAKGNLISENTALETRGPGGRTSGIKVPELEQKAKTTAQTVVRERILGHLKSWGSLYLSMMPPVILAEMR